MKLTFKVMLFGAKSRVTALICVQSNKDLKQQKFVIDAEPTQTVRSSCSESVFKST